jgi:hypothetical protein
MLIWYLPTTVVSLQTLKMFLKTLITLMSFKAIVIISTAAKRRKKFKTPHRTRIAIIKLLIMMFSR